MKSALTYFFIFFTLHVVAQKGWTHRDKMAFDDATFDYYQGDLHTAFNVFSELYALDPGYAPLNYQLGVCYLDLYNDQEKALDLLRMAAANGETEAIFHYGRALHQTEAFDAALLAFQTYLSAGKREEMDESVWRQIRMVERAKKMIAQPVDLVIKNLGANVNSPYQDYVPVYSDQERTLYFTSRRAGGVSDEKDPNDEYFEDVYYSHLADGEWSFARNIGAPINTETHDATAGISADGKTMLVYRTQRNLMGGDLYISHKTGEQWSEPEKLNERINSKYQEASACLSADGKTLYFSSNRPGGYGGKDIYRVKMLPNGEWSLPKNLGPNINTKYDEDAPFIKAGEERFYFASKGHQTMGGYDIFYAEAGENETWSLPTNMGYPLNSVRDDIYIYISPDGRSGFYASDQFNGLGKMDIYSIDFIYRNDYQIVCRGVLQGSDQEAVKGSIYVTERGSYKSPDIYQTTSSGKFILVINPEKTYDVEIEADGYKSLNDSIKFEIPANKIEAVYVSPYTLSKVTGENN